MNTVDQTNSKRFIVVLGLPCSGKRRFVEKNFGATGFIRLEIDRLARRLPEYKPITAVRMYEEAADVAALILSKAIQGSQHIVVQTVGRNQEDLVRLALAAKRFEYTTELLWIRLSPIKSAKRALDRFEDPADGVFIDPAYIIEDLCLSPGNGLISSGAFDRWQIWEAGKTSNEEPIFLRGAVTRREKTYEKKYYTGIDWARAWESRLAKAAEILAAKALLIEADKPDPHF